MADVNGRGKEPFEGSFEELIAALFGERAGIVGRRSVHGGDINESYCLSLSDGTAVFLKCNTLANYAFFEAEKQGLEALRQTKAIGVPKVLGMGKDREKRISFLLLEYLEASPRRKEYWEIFGRELAALHLADTGNIARRDKPFGFKENNFIGASVQVNTPKESWTAFFRDCRLEPQMNMAEGYLDSGMRKQCRRLLDHLDSYITEPEIPSLLHGDLWSGNAVCGPDGKAWILDPAVYVGHFEAELAMTELFGGYPPSFYSAYHEINRIDNGYQDRRDLYNLYHMLNHLNLFGSSYKACVKRILDRYAGK